METRPNQMLLLQVSGQGSNGELHIPRSSGRGASLSDGLMLYIKTLVEGILRLCTDAVGLFYSPGDWAGLR